MQWPHLRGSGQFKAGYVKAAKRIRETIVQYKPETVIIEDYRVYPWRLKQQSWSALETVRLIGAIELVCSDLGVRCVLQGAHKGKIISDAKLRQWGIYKVGKTHTNDAIRHLVSYIIFADSKGGKRARSSRYR